MLKGFSCFNCCLSNSAFLSLSGPRANNNSSGALSERTAARSCDRAAAFAVSASAFLFASAATRSVSLLAAALSFFRLREFRFQQLLGGPDAEFALDCHFGHAWPISFIFKLLSFSC
jgi:hypothetical protein